MGKEPHRPRMLQWSLFRGSEVVRRGLLTAHQLRSSAWVRVRHDVYADARLDQDHELACRAVALWLPAGAALAGPSAAYLHGVEHAAGFFDDVHVIVGPDRRLEPQRGVRVHRVRFRPTELATVSGLPSTTPMRTAWDLACWLDPVAAVTTIDGMLRRGLVDDKALAVSVEARSGQRGCRRARWAFDLADARAESPPESQLRVRLVLAGLPRPMPQHPVRVAGGAIYHPDLAWPEYRVAVEYDGHWHGHVEQLHRDRRRLNQLVGAGWIVLHVTSQRLHRDFHGIVREARTALRSRGWHGQP